MGNLNMEGVEVEARNDKDVLPAQQEAVGRLAYLRGARWGYDPRSGVYGHGELNADKEASEGMSSVSRIRTGELTGRGVGSGVAFLTGGESTKGYIPSVSHWTDTVDRTALDRPMGTEIWKSVTSDGRLIVRANNAPTGTSISAESSGVLGGSPTVEKSVEMKKTEPATAAPTGGGGDGGGGGGGGDEE